MTTTIEVEPFGLSGTPRRSSAARRQITTASRIAVCTCTGSRSTIALARNAPGNATQPISSATATTLASTAPNTPNTPILTMPIAIEIAASVAITAAPCRPAAISIDSRMIPAPAGAADHHAPQERRDREALVVQGQPVALRQAAQRHAQGHHAADHHHRAAAGEQRVAPGAEHRGRQRANDNEQRAAPVDHLAERGRAARVGEQRRDRDDRHHRLGADDRHQHQRHQRAGAVAGDAADDRGDRRHRGDQRQFGGGEALQGGEHAPPYASRARVATSRVKSAGEISTLNCRHQMITLW